MSAPPPGDTPPRSFPRYPRPRRMQFSLRTLLIVMTGVAIGVVLLTALGSDFMIGIFGALAVFATPVCFVTAAIYARGRIRTFCIGAAVVTCLAATNPPIRISTVTGALAFVFFHLVAATIGGAVALATRWFVERRRWHVPPDERNSWVDD